MSEQAEFAPTPISTETEVTEATSTPEATSEVRESAGHAAALIALTETAAHNDLPQDRVDVMRAQIDAKFATETPRVGGLVSAIEAAHAESQDEERSHAAALAAIEQGNKRAELLNLEETATHAEWPQDRVDAAKNQIEAKYAAK